MHTNTCGHKTNRVDLTLYLTSTPRTSGHFLGVCIRFCAYVRLCLRMQIFSNTCTDMPSFTVLKPQIEICTQSYSLFNFCSKNAIQMSTAPKKAAIWRYLCGACGRSLEDGMEKLGGWKRERTYINIGGVQLE